MVVLKEREHCLDLKKKDIFPVPLYVVRFPDPLGKWVGGTNPSRAGNFTSEASSSEKVAGTPPHDTHRWILQHVDNAWELSKLGQVNSGRS